MPMEQLKTQDAVSTPTQVEWRDFLNLWLQERIRKNPQYSLRAMARQVGICHSTLSLLMNGKRNLTSQLRARLVTGLKLTPSEASILVLSRPTQSVHNEFGAIDLDVFALISDWEHYAVLSLMDIVGFKSDPKWIGERLGISVKKADVVFKRLLRLGMLQRMRNGRWKQTKKPIRVENAVSTRITKNFHRQLLKKAIESLETDAAEERNFSSITFASNPENMQWACEQIKEFRRRLCKQLEKRAKRSEVYNLTIQLYPVSHATATIKKKGDAACGS